MSSNLRKHGGDLGKSEQDSRTTADATPALATMIQGMSAGARLEQQLGRAFSRIGQPFESAGVSLSWLGTERLVKRLTALGCYVEIQTHDGFSVCRILRMLKGNAIAKQLASIQAPSLPEAVAKAALLSLLEMEPPAAGKP